MLIKKFVKKKLYTLYKMILLLRGHIRNSFETNHLLNFIKNIYKIDQNI